jgi:hypothetical protein
MILRNVTLVLAATLSLGLAACHKATNTGAQGADPQQATSANTGNTKAMGGPGSGLNGGLGQNTAPGQATGVAEGSKNSTTKGAVGNR